MSNWDYGTSVPTINFRSANTVPRELTLKSNGEHLILNSFPVKEVNSLRSNTRKISNMVVEKESSIAEILSKNKGTYEIELTLKPENSTTFGFELKNAKNEELKFTFDLKTKKLSIDRANSGKIDFKSNFKDGTSAPLVVKDSYNVRLLVDKASAEIFINNGEIAMTSLFFPTEIMNTLNFFATQGKLNAENITIYNIK
jgi:fructan beta-fructosidase